MLYNRLAENVVRKNMEVFPAVAVLGSRQCGKSTLIKMMAENGMNMLYLDLQNRRDLARLEEPELFFRANEDKTICLDEIQLVPNLFAILRSEIDRMRRPGRFILLGSASRELIQHTSESLAGRIGLIDLTPLLLCEINKEEGFDLNRYWFRGGYPDSYMSSSNEASALWRENFIRTYIERDIPSLGYQITSRQMVRLMTMCAHVQGQLLNASKLGDSLDVTHQTVKRYLDVLEQTYLLRTLPPFFSNTKKRLVKSPKIYLRDSGILHQLLGLDDFNALLGHPVFGSSWEGVVVENVCAFLSGGDFSFYRSSTGEEIDLIVQHKGRMTAIECKASAAPQLSSGFWKALDFLHPDATFVVTPFSGQYPLKNNVQVCGLAELLKQFP